jgi:hypothetical protein
VERIIKSIGQREATKEANSPKSAQRRGERTSLPSVDISQADALRWVGKEPEPLEFAIDELAPKGMVTAKVADGGAGKSLLGQTVMTCIALGRPFLDRTVVSGSAAGIFAEDPDNVLHLRQRRINSVFDTSMEELIGKHFAQSYVGCDVVLWRDWAPTKLFAEIESQLASIPGLQLVVIDNAALIFAGNENDRVEVTQFISALTALAIRLSVAILLILHTSKSSDKSVARAGSGSTAWIWACRSVLKLERGEEEHEASLTLIKANHAKPGVTIPLVWQDGVLVRKPDSSSFDERLRRRRLDQFMFERICQAWDAGWPLSPAPQTKERYLPKSLASDGEFSAKELAEAMSGHLKAGNIAVDQKTARSPKGLRVKKTPFETETLYA